MNILVCIKPDTSGQEIGPFESLALEAGLQLREACGGRVDVITAGPESWRGILRRALGTGADTAVHIVLEPADGAGGLVPAQIPAALIAAWAGLDDTPAYELILTGVMSQDLSAGQTGPMLAEYMGVAHASAVIQMERQGNVFQARREWEGGRTEIIDIALPAVMSVQSGHYTARYPALSHMLKAKSKPLTVVVPEEIEKCAGRALPGQDPVISFDGLQPPEKIREGIEATGPVEEQVRAFRNFLRERGIS